MVRLATVSAASVSGSLAWTTAVLTERVSERGGREGQQAFYLGDDGGRTVLILACRSRLFRPRRSRGARGRSSKTV